MREHDPTTVGGPGRVLRLPLVRCNATRVRPLPGEQVEPEEPLARPLARENKPASIGCPVGRAPRDWLPGTGDMRGSAPVQADDPRPLLAAFVVHAEQEPSAVGRDVRLELEDAFEVEEFAKGGAVGACDVRSVGAREDDAPPGQLVRDTRRRVTCLAASSRSRLTFTAVRTRRGQSGNERDKYQALAALHASLLHRCGPPRFR